MNAVTEGLAVDKGPAPGANPQLVQAEACFLTQPQDDEMLLGSLQHGEFRLKLPLRLQLSEKNGHVSVYCADLRIEAKGATTGTALEAFRNMVIHAEDDATLRNFVERVKHKES